MLSHVFPGQGAQRKGMLGLAADFPDLMAQADGILGYSLEELCQRDPERRLNRTCYTQPALFVANALAELKHRDGLPGGAGPDFVLGHSLGEYNALFAAGVLDFATALRLVQKRGALMDKASGGAMAVVIGLTAERIEDLVQAHGLALDLANLNAPDQVALSGLKAEIDRARPLFQDEAQRWVPLKVSAAFHSRHMADAATAFATFLEDVAFAPPQVPVISNVTARPHDMERFGALLAQQIRAPVRWTESIQWLCDQGVDRFEELGPGTTLTGLIDRIRAARPALVPVAKPQKQAQPPPLNRPLSHPGLAACAGQRGIAPETLGSQAFRDVYGLRYAYLAGSMYKGIAAPALVIRLGKAGLMGFFGAGGVALARVDEAISEIRQALPPDRCFGVNLLANPGRPDQEMALVDLLLRRSVSVVEASGYTQLSPALVRYRLAGLVRREDGHPIARNRVIAKLSRPEIAKLFLAPPPRTMVTALLDAGLVTPDQAALSAQLPLVDDICVEADSAGHTDRRSATALFPAVSRLRLEMMEGFAPAAAVRVGLAGGIGTPEAAAAAFMLGADFILTGSINQCTPEAGISAAAKDLLAQMDIQDTDYAPAGDLFEIGSQIQVLKRGLLFPARANRLYELYRSHDSLDSIDPATRHTLETQWFGRSLEAVYAETREYWRATQPAEVDRAERDPKRRMALVFKWYFVHTMRLALSGDPEDVVNYQIHCSPALGGFNRWVKGTELEPWSHRSVDVIAERLMQGTADCLNTMVSKVTQPPV